jgi:hypothetical protein
MTRIVTPPDLELHPATGRLRANGALLLEFLAWIWAIAAAGGALWLLAAKGPWPLTNGWFALASGIAACPATAWLLKYGAGIVLSGRVRFAAAAFFFLAGQAALEIGKFM